MLICYYYYGNNNFLKSREKCYSVLLFFSLGVISARNEPGTKKNRKRELSHCFCLILLCQEENGSNFNLGGLAQSLCEMAQVADQRGGC
jgi:hypothetical protein